MTYTSKDLKESMSNIKVDTILSYFDVPRFPIEIVKEGETVISYDVKTREIVITKEMKFEILHAIGKALGDLHYPPFIILLPKNKFPKHITFRDPIPFMKNYLYIVPYIRNIEVYELPEEPEKFEYINMVN